LPLVALLAASLYYQPYIPFVQLNYILAVSCVSFRDYLFSTAVGILPGSCLYVFIGTGVKNLAAYFQGTESIGPAPVIMSVVGVVVAIGAFVGECMYVCMYVYVLAVLFSRALPAVAAGVYVAFVFGAREQASRCMHAVS
jgi:hypothetical protein